MLNISCEFRKGIFFLRLIGELTQYNCQEQEKIIEEILITNRFRCVVINTNYLNKLDITGLNTFIRICDVSRENNNTLIICDKYNVFSKLFNNVPNIKDELEVL